MVECCEAFATAAGLPRSKERGLIEAVKFGDHTVELHFLPRSKERGLIEATFHTKTQP